MLRKLAGGGSALALTYLAVELCAVARVALFAHVLAPASMGALIVLGAWLRLVEMATDLSLDRFLLRERHGVRRRVQNAAHGAALLRGLAGSAIMIATIWPLLAIYGLQAQPAGFLAAALVPFIRGFLHTDYRLQNRFLRLRSTITIESASAAAGLAAAACGAFLAPGPEAFAGALMAQACASVILSHVLATRPYAISFDREISRRIWHFGWPLTVNALFLYAVFQGERMLVGGMLGLETLGSYGIVAQLALLPVMISGRLALNIALPLLAGTRAEQTAGGARDVASIFASGGLLFWAVFVFACPPFIALLFGEAYQPHPADLGWIAAAAAIRMQKTGPATVLLAAGRSRAVLAGSSIRLAGLGIGTLLLFLTRDLTVFVATAAISEAA
ncbi:MAG: oligosaccharide flippase family protein, partial [Nitratireductor sp.]|nr:oligosaccharide flippase family protein [Nitratireductor sp.]